MVARNFFLLLLNFSAWLLLNKICTPFSRSLYSYLTYVDFEITKWLLNNQFHFISDFYCKMHL